MPENRPMPEDPKELARAMFRQADKKAFDGVKKPKDMDRDLFDRLKDQNKFFQEMRVRLQHGGVLPDDWRWSPEEFQQLLDETEAIIAAQEADFPHDEQ